LPACGGSSSGGRGQIESYLLRSCEKDPQLNDENLHGFLWCVCCFAGRCGNEPGRAGLCLNRLGLRPKPWPFTCQRLYFKPDLAFLKA